jgi:superoxide dismutase, Fe-Mn family
MSFQVEINDELKEQIRQKIKKDLGISVVPKDVMEAAVKNLEEAYVVTPAKHSLPTELLSSKTKGILKKKTEALADSLNRVSAEIDAVDRESVNSTYSRYADLKRNEARLINENFLLGMHLSNISDVNSVIAMDSLAFLRLERDFGTFENWQKDFIACAMAAPSGYAVTAYNTDLKRYINLMVDGEQRGTPVGTHPVIVLSVCGSSYVRDYLDDRKTYVFAMMKEFDWDTIEGRFKKTEKISKVLK